MQEGVNIFRVRPPTNSRGLIARRVGKHWFGDTSLAKLFEKPLQCLTATHADVEGVVCPIHAAGDRLLAQHPQLKLNRWLNEGNTYQVQVYMKEQGGEDVSGTHQAGFLRLSGAVHNWLVMEMEDALKRGAWIADLEAGIDVKVTKTTKKVKGRGGKPRSQTNYEKSLWNLTGPTPLHVDPAVRELILGSMKNPDEIWKYPEDEKLAELNEASTKIINFYTKKVAEEQVGVGGMVGIVTPQTLADTPAGHLLGGQQIDVAKQTFGPVADGEEVIEGTVEVHGQVVAQTTAIVNPKPALPIADQPAPQVVQPQVAQPTPVQQGSEPTPQDRPACFGGAVSRNDGVDPEIGYNEEAEVCLMCKYELSCMDTCANKGAA